MSIDKLNKIHVSGEAELKLRMMKGRTGLTPNLLCRLGLGLSLRKAGTPDPGSYPTDGIEFNRYTLMGHYDLLFVSLVKERCLKDGLDPEADWSEQLRAHVNRGVGMLASRLKTLGDLVELLPSEPAEAS